MWAVLNTPSIIDEDEKLGRITGIADSGARIGSACNVIQELLGGYNTKVTRGIAIGNPKRLRPIARGETRDGESKYLRDSECRSVQKHCCLGLANTICYWDMASSRADLVDICGSHVT